jgi:hypothetical protein
MREVIFSYLAFEKPGPWTSKIQEPFDIPGEVRPALQLLASLKLYTWLRDPEQVLQLKGSVIAIVFYMIKLKLQSHQVGLTADKITLSSCLQNSHSIFISQASSVSLSFLSFQDDDKSYRNLIRCTQNWRGKGARSDFVILYNEVVGSTCSIRLDREVIF